MSALRELWLLVGHVEKASLSPTEIKFYVVLDSLTVVCSVTENHGIIGWFGLGRTFKDHVV